MKVNEISLEKSTRFISKIEILNCFSMKFLILYVIVGHMFFKLTENFVEENTEYIKLTQIQRKQASRVVIKELAIKMIN